MVLSYYPSAKFVGDEDKIYIEYGTRIFKVHHPLWTGEWQDAIEVKGPQKNGVAIDILLRPGRYQGAAFTPQTFEEYYFNRLVLTPGSEKFSCYLHVTLLYPIDASPEFIKAFMALVNNFESYLN